MVDLQDLVPALLADDMALVGELRGLSGGVTIIIIIRRRRRDIIIYVYI